MINKRKFNVIENIYSLYYPARKLTRFWRVSSEAVYLRNSLTTRQFSCRMGILCVDVIQNWA